MYAVAMDDMTCTTCAGAGLVYARLDGHGNVAPEELQKLRTADRLQLVGTAKASPCPACCGAQRQVNKCTPTG